MIARRLAQGMLAAALCGLAGSAVASPALVPPPGYRIAPPAKPKGKPYACSEAPAPFTGALDFPSKYEGSGSARDQYNAAADAEFKRRAAPITALEKGVVDQVKKYLHNGQPGALGCTLAWLGGWARADALLGAGKTHTGRSERKWALASIASAWVRLRFAASAPLARYPDESRQIEAWLAKLGERVSSEWPASDPLDKINNHYYWTAWALVATGVATGRNDLYDDGLKLYRVFESQVSQDGLLANEMARASRALGYHAYALQPLTMIAAFGKANGADLVAEGDGALGRLAARVMQAANEPEAFAEAAGTEQAEGLDKPSAWAWLEPYCWAAGNCPAAFIAQRDGGRPYSVTRMGGDLTTLFSGVGP